MEKRPILQRGPALRNTLLDLAKDFHEVNKALEALERNEPGSGDRLDNKVKLLEQTFSEIFERYIR